MSFKATNLLALLIALSFCGCASKKVQKKSSKPEITAPLCITSADSNLLNTLDYTKISGTNPSDIINYIKEFPFTNYEVFSVQSLTGIDSFCIDDIPDFIKTELRSGKTWESHLEPYFIKYCKPGSTALDIGAHIGTHSLTMSRCVGPKGKVIAFEPQPKAMRELVVNMAINQADNIDYFWGGASRIHEQMTLNIPNPQNEGGVSLGSGTGRSIEVIPLDLMNLSNVSLIKIDVEGMEESVLLGAKETIEKNKPAMIIEICGGNVPEKSNPEIRAEILRRIKLVESFGYKVMRLCDSSDYLALPENSQEFKEVCQTKLYKHHIKQLKKWQEKKIDQQL